MYGAAAPPPPDPGGLPPPLVPPQAPPTADPWATLANTSPVLMIVGALGGYFAGRAMAPSKGREGFFGILGAVAGAVPAGRLLLLGSLGYYATKEQGP